jgi:glycosyltransferase involved in cell wall biosynthesis
MRKNINKFDYLQYNFSIAIAVLAKNEEYSIRAILKDILTFIKKEDIFVIDGQSTDNTRRITEDMGIRVYSDNGKGKGAGIKWAINNIHRDILVFMDADASHRPAEIKDILLPFSNNYCDVDMAIGSRFLGHSDELDGSPSLWLRRIGNKLSVYILNKVWRQSLTDIQNGFRAIKRTSIQQLNLRENSFAIEQEMVMKCLTMKKKIIEVPTWELKRLYGKSKLNPSKMLCRFILSFICNIYNHVKENLFPKEHIEI